MSVLSGLAGAVLQPVFGGTVGSTAGPFTRDVSYYANYFSSSVVPDPAGVLWAYRVGLLDSDSAQKLLRINGIPWNPPANDPTDHNFGNFDKLANAWQQVYQSQEPQPALGELLTLVNRERLNTAEAEESLHRRGFTDARTRRNLLSLRFEIPGPSDIVRFAVKEVFDAAVVELYGYNKEFPPQFNYWLEKQGYGGDARAPSEKAAGRPPYTWANAYWWSHWQNPSPTQGYNMLHRLRGDGGPDGGPRDPSGQIFSQLDLNTLLKVNDYAPFWRDKLAAVSYRVPGIRQMRQLDELGLVDLPELVEKFKDQGYNGRDAKMLADLTRYGNQATKFRASIQGVKGRVLKAYKVGILERGEAARQLYYSTFRDPNLAKDYAARSEAEQTAIALADAGIRLQLDTVDHDEDAALAGAAVTALKRLYLKGHIDRPTAMARLIGAGIVVTRRDQIIDHWDQLLDRSRRELTTAQVQNYVRRGILNVPEAQKRFRNLGWTDADALLLMAEAARNVALDQARAAQAVARTQKQQQAAAKALIAEARREHDRARAELARHGTPAQLARWLEKGYIQRPEAYNRLIKLDWPPADANRLIDEALDKRAAAQAKRRAAPSTNGATV